MLVGLRSCGDCAQSVTSNPSGTAKPATGTTVGPGGLRAAWAGAGSAARSVAQSASETENNTGKRRERDMGKRGLAKQLRGKCRVNVRTRAAQGSSPRARGRTVGVEPALRAG